MEILTSQDEEKIVAELLKGKTVVFPTETSYGLLCDATNEGAVRNVFEIKGRSRAKAVLVVVSNVEMAKEYLKWNEVVDKIARKYWPGALTVVGEVVPPLLREDRRRGLGPALGKRDRRRGLAEGVVSEDKTVAVRVTGYGPLKSLVEKVGRPLVATSANVSGKGEIYSGTEMILKLGKQNFQPDYVVDFGVLPKRKPTTIVRVLKNKVEILRKGEVIVKL